MNKRSFLILFLIGALFVACLQGCSFKKPGVTPDAETTTVVKALSHGTFQNYEFDEFEDHVVLTDCLSDQTTVWLPRSINNKPVTGFGTIFARNFKLNTIHIPGCYEEIVERAFYMCDHLKTVNVDSGLKSIGKEAFAGCSSLSVAKIPATVTQIADDAFLYCLNLVIFGEEGSAIQQYADRFQSINFRPVEPETTNDVSKEDVSDTTKEDSSETTTVKETTTQAATTQAATTQPPATEPPATQPPTEPPATEPPTQPPTEPPTEAETTTIPDDQLDI